MRITPAKTFGAFLLLIFVAFGSLSVDAPGSAAATQGDQIAALAASQAGVPYCDGGGSINGPTNGGVVEPGCGAGVKGFDCVTLVQYAVYQATEIALPGNGTQPSGVGTFIAPQATDRRGHGRAAAGRRRLLGRERHQRLQPLRDLCRQWERLGCHRHQPAGPAAHDDLSAIGLQLRRRHEVLGNRRPPPEGSCLRWSAWPPRRTAAATGWPTPSGGVSAHGSAVNYGSMAGHLLNAPIAHIVSTPDGGGYWLVAADGGIFSFGDAPFYGSMGGRHLNAPVVDIAPTPDGGGYWLVAADGGIFAFGDAPFSGSMGGRHLNAAVVGISADDATGGYWEVATDGGIFAFGAPFLGQHRRHPPDANPSTGWRRSPTGTGYWFVASDGGIFSEGSAPFHGSMGGATLNAAAVGMASDPPPAGTGWWRPTAACSASTLRSTAPGRPKGLRPRRSARVARHARGLRAHRGPHRRR